MNDVSEREVQLPELKSGLLNLGKNFPTFGPMGPWVVTADEVPNPEDIEISCTVNDEPEPRQSSNTKHLIFGMSLQVAHFSRMGLEPGDVITTGTPSGVAVFRDPPSLGGSSPETRFAVRRPASEPSSIRWSHPSKSEHPQKGDPPPPGQMLSAQAVSGRPDWCASVFGLGAQRLYHWPDS